MGAGTEGDVAARPTAGSGEGGLTLSGERLDRGPHGGKHRYRRRASKHWFAQVIADPIPDLVVQKHPVPPVAIPYCHQSWTTDLEFFCKAILSGNNRPLATTQQIGHRNPPASARVRRWAPHRTSASSFPKITRVSRERLGELLIALSDFSQDTTVRRRLFRLRFGKLIPSAESVKSTVLCERIRQGFRGEN